MTQSINNSKNQSKDITTKVALTNDSCMTCPWLNKQPEGNKMLCILPGNCFWLAGWKDKDNA